LIYYFIGKIFVLILADTSSFLYDIHNIFHSSISRKIILYVIALFAFPAVIVSKNFQAVRAGVKKLRRLKKEQHPLGVALDWDPPYITKYYEQPELVSPQPEHPDPAPKSILLSILKPRGVKSILIGFICSMNSLSIMYLNPSMSYTSSLFFSSSRAIAREGPPHPPEFRNIRIGETSLPLK
jgi:hypothetical protein